MADSDLNQYTKLANEGMMLVYPVKVNGKDRRPDNNIIYHSTIKLLDPTKDHAHKVHELAQHLPFNPPDARDVEIEPATLQGRTGYTMHVLKLKGPHMDKMKEHNGKFAHMGFQNNHQFEPHITVDKELWDHISKNNIKNAHEAGIEFGPAQLRKGPNILKVYHHEPDSNAPKVPDQSDYTAKVNVPKTEKSEDIHGKKPLAKPFLSEAQRRWGHTAAGKEALGGEAGVHEWDEATKGKKLPERVGKGEELEKGLKEAAVAGMMGLGAMNAAPHPAQATSLQPVQAATPNKIVHRAGMKPQISPASIPHQVPFDQRRVLGSLSQAESSNNPHVEHHVIKRGPDKGTRAYGLYGLTNSVIHDSIKAHKDLRSKHGRALSLRGDQLNRYMADNPGLDKVIADRFVAHIKHRFGNEATPGLVHYIWLNGITGALKAKKAGEDIRNHWRYKKGQDFYNKGK
jgi:hypothetical protein